MKRARIARGEAMRGAGPRRRGVTGGGEQFLPVVGVPDGQAAVAIGAGEHFTVGTEGERHDPVGVLLDLVLQFSGLGGVDLHQAVGTAERDLGLVRTDVGGEDRIVFFADGGDAFAGFDVPKQDAAGLRPAAAARDEELARAREFNIPRLAFGERQDAEQVEVRGVVEQDLLLPGDGDERRPRAGGESVDRVTARGVNNRINGQLLRHRRRTVGLAKVRDFQREVHRGLRGRDGFRPGSFEQAAGDPFPEHHEILLRQRRFVRWHRRLFGMRNGLDELARIGTETKAAVCPLRHRFQDARH